MGIRLKLFTTNDSNELIEMIEWCINLDNVGNIGRNKMDKILIVLFFLIFGIKAFYYAQSESSDNKAAVEEAYIKADEKRDKA